MMLDFAALNPFIRSSWPSAVLFTRGENTLKKSRRSSEAPNPTEKDPETSKCPELI